MADEIKKAVTQMQFDLVESRLKTLDKGLVLTGPAAIIHSMERLVAQEQLEMMREKYGKWLAEPKYKMDSTEMAQAMREGKPLA